MDLDVVSYFNFAIIIWILSADKTQIIMMKLKWKRHPEMTECNWKDSGTTKNKWEDRENKQGKNYYTNENEFKSTD